MQLSYKFTEDIERKRIKYRIKKFFLLNTDKYEKIIYTLFFISIFIYIRNSNYPLIYKNLIFRNVLITEQSNYSQLIESISLSITGSCIFYIITEIFPYKRKKLEYSSEIEIRVFEVYSLLKRILCCIFIDEKKGIKFLEENRIRESEMLLRTWEDEALFFPTVLVFEEVEKVVIELREKIDKLLVFENFLDYELREIIYSIPRTHLFNVLPYSRYREYAASSNISLCYIYDIFEIVILIRKYAVKNKKLKKVLLELRNYESTISQLKKDLEIKSGFSEYLGIYRQYLKKKDLKNAEKYLILALQKKDFYLMNEEYRALNFFALEKENKNILYWEKYLALRSEIIGVSKESKNIKEILDREYVKKFID